MVPIASSISELRVESKHLQSFIISFPNPKGQNCLTEYRLLILRLLLGLAQDSDPEDGPLAAAERVQLPLQGVRYRLPKVVEPTKSGSNGPPHIPLEEVHHPRDL